ncbi:hypothetical protein [Polymorphum gilvum]|uniref:Uncharacterized protein n=1 Tax=Polymorphum gilvum (strain LMG 25793 / CGMCC 1.9160 / SL003B-26A1) TaxID=991905 RepID=F2J1D2_POLGS|nr:hypothetical protein [Polymorphum gilvum]ADZ69714.1 hypothetical protein SL003B_1286 [Polymorphum gilvum SL003B-26A1]
MTERPGFLTELDRRASEAQQEEVRFRRSFAEEVARRERARVFAFRRAGFMARMTAVCIPADSDEAAAKAAQAAICAEFGWSGGSEAHARILDRFAPVAEAVRRSVTGAADETDPIAEMADFEDWYAETTGSPFLALFDQEPLEAPVVEF